MRKDDSIPPVRIGWHTLSERPRFGVEHNGHIPNGLLVHAVHFAGQWRVAPSSTLHELAPATPPVSRTDSKPKGRQSRTYLAGITNLKVQSVSSILKSFFEASVSTVNRRSEVFTSVYFFGSGETGGI